MYVLMYMLLYLMLMCVCVRSNADEYVNVFAAMLIVILCVRYVKR